MSLTPSDTSEETDWDDNAAHELVVKAYNGDQEACSGFYALLEQHGLADAYTLLVTNTIKQTVEAQEPNLILHEALRRKMALMQHELGWQTAPALERLLIERIIVCWLHVRQSEQRMTTNINKGVSFAGATFYEQSVDRAQKRYMQAIQSLALVRRLNIPAVQVNIADKQINIASSNNASSSRAACLNNDALP